MGLSNAQLGFILVCFAGMATGLGAAIIFSEKLVSMATKQVLASALAVSGGVMLYVSFVEILVKSQMAFEAPLGPSDAYLAATASLFGGMAFMAAVDAVVHRLDPSHAASHSSDPSQFVATEVSETTLAQVELGAAQGAPSAAESTLKSPSSSEGRSSSSDEGNAKTLAASADKDAGALQHMGVMTAIAIGLHNFPEGLATFVATVAEPAVGVALAIAIAIHNVPEGVCVAMPIYFATGNRMKAFRWALLSGVSEPIGAALGWIVLANAINQVVYGIIFGAVAGMMVMIVMHELMPTAHKYDPNDKVVTKSFCAGMAVMAASLVLFVYS